MKEMLKSKGMIAFIVITLTITFLGRIIFQKLDIKV